ncbi:MAG: rhodanese-like domain-containing protein [Nitrospirota bacterium]
MSRQPLLVLDVRTEGEWQAGHIEGSVKIPLTQLRARASELHQSRPIVVSCQSGYRSSIATSLLAREGMADVIDLVGGYEAWAKTWGRRKKIAT